MITLTWGNQVARVTVDDALDVSSCSQLLTTVRNASKTASHVLVDLTPCRYIDCFSVDAVLKLCLTDVSYVVIPGEGNIRKVLTLVDVIDALPLVVDVDEATERLNSLRQPKLF
jgi:hypothetical protein